MSYPTFEAHGICRISKYMTQFSGWGLGTLKVMTDH